MDLVILTISVIVLVIVADASENYFKLRSRELDLRAKELEAKLNPPTGGTPSKGDSQ